MSLAVLILSSTLLFAGMEGDVGHPAEDTQVGKVAGKFTEESWVGLGVEDDYFSELLSTPGAEVRAKIKSPELVLDQCSDIDVSRSASGGRSYRVQTHDSFHPLASGSYQFTSGFGVRLHPTLGTYLMHTGVDLAAPSGTPVYAMKSGLVEKVGYDDISGHHIVLDHGDEVRTVYKHAEQEYILVSEGEEVEAGQQISGVGNTGRSTGAHLHFEVTIDGEHTDPKTYLQSIDARDPSDPCS